MGFKPRTMAMIFLNLWNVQPHTLQWTKYSARPIAWANSCKFGDTRLELNGASGVERIRVNKMSYLLGVQSLIVLRYRCTAAHHLGNNTREPLRF
jgi:hypothetical protein